MLRVVQEARELMESAMREVMAIAGAAKVHLYEADLENWYSVLSGLSPQGKTSMLQDVEAKRKTEVEMFAGKVIELGKTYNIPTPINETIFRLISVIERYKEVVFSLPGTKCPPSPQPGLHSCPHAC